MPSSRCCPMASPPLRTSTTTEVSPSLGRVPPRVSIVVIGFNDAEHLPAALQSAQAQTLRDIEIVVVDDASSDASMDVARACAVADPRIHVHRLDANSGGLSHPPPHTAP